MLQTKPRSCTSPWGHSKEPTVDPAWSLSPLPFPGQRESLASGCPIGKWVWGGNRWGMARQDQGVRRATPPPLKNWGRAGNSEGGRYLVLLPEKVEAAAADRLSDEVQPIVLDPEVQIAEPEEKPGRPRAARKEEASTPFACAKGSGPGLSSSARARVRAAGAWAPALPKGCGSYQGGFRKGGPPSPTPAIPSFVQAGSPPSSHGG